MWNFQWLHLRCEAALSHRLCYGHGYNENAKKYNKLVYSTGFHYRLAIKELWWSLSYQHMKSRIKIFGPDLVNETGGVYDEKTGTVKFERDTYLAPMNRYTVRVVPNRSTQTAALPVLE